MTNTLLALILLSLALLTTGIAVFVHKVSRVYSEFRVFISPAENNQPSPLALVVDACATSFSRAIIAQAKATFMANQSAAARGEKAIEGDIALDALNMSNPLVGMILKNMPALSKSLRRNPGLLDLALSKLNLASKTSAVPPGNGSSEKPGFGFNK